MKRFLCVLLAVVMLASMVGAASAAPKRGGTCPPPATTRAAKATHVHIARLKPLNDSGVRGIAIFRIKNGVMNVKVVARGVEASQTHLQHIHGFAGETTESVCPPPTAAGTDGILTLEEGLPFYGPVLLPLEPFPTANAKGQYVYRATFTDLSAVDPLHMRTIVIHGMTVNGVYEPTLPVACAEIHLAGKRKGWFK